MQNLVVIAKIEARKLSPNKYAIIIINNIQKLKGSKFQL